LKRYLILLTIAAAGSLFARSAQADCNDPFGKPNELLDFHLKMSRADWNGLVANRPGESCNAVYKDFKAEFRCGTEGPWLKVAVRKKRGEQRGIEAPQKPPLKIDFNETFMNTVPEAMGQSWPPSMGKLGYRKLTLNNGQGNKFGNTVIPLPLLMAEHVAMRLLKRELPSAPGTAYAKITIHTEDKPDGEYHGVYILLEDIDKSALRRRFGRDDGRLIKASKDACPVDVEFDDGPPNAARTAYEAWIGGAAAASATIEQAEKAVDLDTLLRQEAIREILVNGDDTIATSVTSSREGLNFYFFEPRMGLRHYIPWDTDLAFGQQNENCAPNSLKCPPTEKIGRWCPAVSRIGQATVCQPNVRKRYLEIMCQLINGSMAADEILKVWEEAYATVKDVVPLEKDIAWGGRDPSDPGINKSFGAEYVRLKSWIPARINSVRQQISCATGCPAGKTEACTYLTCEGERRCENNRWTACQPKAACSPAAPPMTGGSDAGAPADAGSSQPPPSGSGGTGGAPPSGSGGSSGSGSGGAMTGAGGSPSTPSGTGGRNSGSGGTSSTPAPSEPPSSGGCQIATAPSSAAGLALPLFVAAVLARLRRRQRRS
jgi:MYXO-CTERM domain-containing protein